MEIFSHLMTTIAIVLTATEGFGALTRTKRSTCSNIVCHNGGTCNNFTASPPCICPLPFIAPHCIAAADYCKTLQPDRGVAELPVCLNGGSCTIAHSDPYFNCSCAPGFSGIRCEYLLSTMPSTSLITDTENIAVTETVTAAKSEIITTSFDTTQPNVEQTKQNSLVLLISLSIGVPLAVALAGGIIAAVFVKTRNRNRQRTSQSNQTKYVWDSN